MPRKSRIDAPGALHHVIARGIDRRKIFLSDADRNSFLDRLGKILTEAKTACYAWALLPNHFHLLLRTGTSPLSAVMRRLLTGYAVTFNLRHKRRGHLFQNRYKSILCQADPYLLELVRYIHLNPLRAGLVENCDDLSQYPYCGHSVILGKWDRPWQDADYILRLFHEKVGIARRRYRAFVLKGIEQGKREDLVGGGLVRSYGGWTEVKAMRKSGTHRRGDERILGGSDFVEQVLAEANENFERRFRLAAQGFDLRRVADRVAELLKMTVEEVLAPGKSRRIVEARSLLCYWATRELGITQSRLSEELGVTQPAISMAVGRGAELVKQNGYALGPG